MNFISFSRPGVVLILTPTPHSPPPPHLSNQALSDLLWVWASTSTVLVIVRLKTGTLTLHFTITKVQESTNVQPRVK